MQNTLFGNVMDCFNWVPGSQTQKAPEGPLRAPEAPKGPSQAFKAFTTATTASPTASTASPTASLVLFYLLHGQFTDLLGLFFGFGWKYVFFSISFAFWTVICCLNLFSEPKGRIKRPNGSREAARPLTGPYGAIGGIQSPKRAARGPREGGWDPKLSARGPTGAAWAKDLSAQGQQCKQEGAWGPENEFCKLNCQAMALRLPLTGSFASPANDSFNGTWTEVHQQPPHAPPRTQNCSSFFFFQK